MVSIGTYLHGYEIKSDSDKLDRFKRQQEIYEQGFEKLTVVAGQRYIDHFHGLPDHWGITLAETVARGAVRLTIFRRAELNPNLTVKGLASFLWRKESAWILKQEGARVGYRSAGAVLNNLIKHFENDLPGLRKYVVPVLAYRRTFAMDLWNWSYYKIHSQEPRLK